MRLLPSVTAVLVFVAAASNPLFAAVSGRMVSSDGTAIAGATIAAFAPETPEARAERLLAGRARVPVATATSAADGSFKIEASAPLLIVEGSAAGFAPAAAAAVPELPVTIEATRAETKVARVSAGGQPVAGAFVVWLAEDAQGATAERLARTAADGSYEVPDPSEWAQQGFVLHTGHAPTELETTPFEKAGEAKHEMTPGVVLTGSLRDENGQPVASATVWVGGWVRWPLGRTGRDGTFRIPHAPAKWQMVSVRHAGLAAAAGRRNGPLALVARTGRSVSGVVSDEAGRPVAGARVSVVSDNGQGALAFTDARGRYVIDGLVAGQYNAAAGRTGHRQASRRGLADPVDLRTAAAAQRDFTLDSVRTARGRVVDPAGRPVGGAIVAFGLSGTPHIYARQPYEDQGGERTFSAADGSFAVELPEVAEGLPEAFKDRPLVVLKAGYAAARVEARDLGTGAPVSVTLSEGVELKGRVRTAAGDPVEGAQVFLVEDGAVVGSLMPSYVMLAALSEDGWTASAPDGTFSVRVNPAVHHLAVRKPGLAPKTVRGHDAAAGAPLEVVLEAAAVLRGHVVRHDGRGVPDVVVSVQDGMNWSRGDSVISGPDGGFEFTSLAPGTYQLNAAHDELGIAETRHVEAPAPDVRIQLAPAGTLRGRVVDATTHRPVTSYRVNVSRAEDVAGSMRSAEVEDAAGAFTMADVVGPQVNVSVIAEGYANGTVEDVAVVTDGDTPVELALEPETAIRGRITDGSGPIAGAAVGAQSADNEHSAGATSDSEGEYELRGLPGGRVTVTVQARGFLPDKRSLDSSQAPRADFSLRRGLALRGDVVRDGAGVPNAMVGARSSVVNAGSPTTQTDERGRFTLEGLAPGRYTVTAWDHENGKAELEDVDVQSTGPVRLVLTAAQTAVVTGRVVGLATGDEPTMAAVLAANEETGARGQALVDPAMGFRIADAPIGRVKVMAYAQTAAGVMRVSRAVELSLAAGAEAEAVLEFSTDVLRGVVTRDGAPVPHAVVSFQSGDDSRAAGRTNGQGAYEVVGVEPGPYKVHVEAEGVSFATEHVVTGPGQFDIDITPASIRGRAVRAEDAAPLAGVQVFVWRTGRGENAPATQATTNASGAFSVPSLQEGRYRLTTSKPGYGQEVREIEVERGTAAEVELALSAAEGVSVTVVDARDGRPLEAIVVVRDGNRRIVANRHSGAADDGVVNIPLANGSYVLSTSATGYGTATVPITAPAEGLRVALTPGGTLLIESRRALRGRVRLVQPDGEEYVQCWCNGIADIQLKGRWTTVENVAAGRYTLEIVDAPESVAPQAVVVAEGQRSTVTID